MNDELNQRLHDLLLGAECTGIEFHGGLPSIVLGNNALYISSSWRVTLSGEIIAGNDSEEDVKQALHRALVSHAVMKLVVNNVFHDLVVEFDNGITLETFADAEHFEHWNLINNGLPVIVAGPGRSCSLFLN